MSASSEGLSPEAFWFAAGRVYETALRGLSIPENAEASRSVLMKMRRDLPALSALVDEAFRETATRRAWAREPVTTV